MYGTRDRGVSMSEVISIVRGKLGEVGMLEQSIRFNGQEIQAMYTQLEAIIGRMELQRQLIRGRASELGELLDLLDSFAEDPPKMDA